MQEKFEEFLGMETIIIFDTNVYLNLYEYSPEIADYFIEAIHYIDDSIYIPSTVKREFLRNHKECSGRQKKKFKNVTKDLKKDTEKAYNQLNNKLSILEKFKFPGIENLRIITKKNLLNIETELDNYLNKHDVHEEINKMFLEQDKILGLFNKIVGEHRILDEISVNELYDICADGKNRYYKEIPPGFKDGKNKDGIDKYNDLIIWKEVMKYCKENSKNLIFVTDDVKKDWWQNKDGNKIFHQNLVKEFEKITENKILGVNSQQLYEILGEKYNITVPDTVENILKYNMESYINKVVKDYDLIENIQSIVGNSDDRYVNTDSLSHYDGSFFELNDEFDKIDLVSYDLDEYLDGIVTYDVTFEAEITANSRCYWGRDDESREIILSDNYYIHKLSGNINVKITREIEEYYIEDVMDNILNDFDFSELQVISIELCEIDVIDSYELCVKCNNNNNIGVVSFGNDGDMVCEECAVGDDEGEICPSCGRKMPFEDMAGNGFCIECTNESDYL